MPISQLHSSESALLLEWAGSHSPIFIDLGNEQAHWWLISGRQDGLAYVGPVSRASFVEMHRGGVTQMARDFDELVKDVTGLVANYESHLQASKRYSSQPLQGFQRYLARRNSRLRRF